MMNNSNVLFLKVFVIGLSIIFMTTGSAVANTQDYGIEVQGQASILVEPDSFVLSIAIIETGRFTDKIRAIVDHKSNQVINIAQNLGIESKDINSARVSLRVIKNDSAIELHGLEVNQRLPNNQKSKVFVGTSSSNQQSLQHNNVKPQFFELSRNIKISFADIKDYDQFLNKVIKIGVNQISPLTMSVNDTDKYYQQALVQAINHAKIKAQKIANQTERNIGKLIFVKELSRNHYRAQYNSRMMSMTSNANHNSQVGNQAISASVLVKYSIE